MPRIETLPADRRAVLQLLLRQGKGYDDIAGLLRIEPATVRERARDALDRLGPADGGGLALERQDELADYLLGQQSASARAETRAFLEDSAAGRAWARVVAGELRAGGMAGEDALPEIPAEGAEVDEAFDALEARKAARVRQRRSSRLGGVLLLGAIGAAIAFFIVFVVSGSDNSSDSGAPVAGKTTTTATTSGPTQVLGQVNLNAPKGSASKALAAVTLVRQGGEVDLLFQGQKVPANQKGDVYALWLTGPRGSARLGFTPRVGKDGQLRFPGALPTGVDLAGYRTMELTRETSADPKKPGAVVLSGTLPNSA